VRLESLQEIAPGTKAGLMIRESLGANSRHAYVAATAGDGHRFGYRAATGGNTSNVFKGLPNPTFPNAWMGIKRDGNVISAAYSSNGTTWVNMGSVAIAMPQTVYFGLAVAAKSTTNVTTAEFRDLTEIIPLPPTVPTGFGATAISATDAVVKWNAVENASKYLVERKGPDDADFVQIGAVTGTSFLNQGLTTGVTYQYRVRAENKAGFSNYTAAASVSPVTGTRGSLDIGNPAPGTTSEVVPGTGYNVAGAGADIWDTSDQFRFVSQQVTGDFDVRVRVTSIEQVTAGVKAGLMARESLAADSRHTFVGLTPTDGFRFSIRSFTAGTTVNSYKGGTPNPTNQWLRLARANGVITAYVSANGLTWTAIGSTTLALPNTVYLGMAVASKLTNTTSTVQFRDLAYVTETLPAVPGNFTAQASGTSSIALAWSAASGASSYRIERKGPGSTQFELLTTVTGTSYTDAAVSAGSTYTYRVVSANSAGLSNPSAERTVALIANDLASADIGNVTPGNTTTVTPGSAYDVTGAGTDIFGSADQARFVFKQLTGDFDVLVQVPGITATTTGAKAGLMVRESLAANSRMLFAGTAQGDGYRFTRRLTTGASATNIYKGGVATAPNVWVRLKRVGDVFTAYNSADGVNWTSMGSTTMALPQTLYVGMAVASKSATTTATAEFRNLSGL
jgi:regulation of enolase protein 1 (concanavalin A-like superfamily)